MNSIHSGNIREIYNIPMDIIIRPLVTDLDESKVRNLMQALKDPAEGLKVPPIDVLWVKGREGGNYYYSFGGCHRYEAFKRLKKDEIPCKIISSTVDDIKIYLGSSIPDFK